MRILVYVFAASLIAPVILTAQARIRKPDGQTIPLNQVTGTIVDLMKQAEVTGLYLGIVENNQPVFTRAYGYSSKPAGIKADTATSLYGASLSKFLFAYLVLELVDRGKIDLDKPLYTYLPKPLPEYKNYRDLAGDERWKLLTARHCLAHTTGFPNWRDLDNPHQNNKLEFFFTPGQFFSYSGEGIELLQFVIEIITTKDLETLAKENIFIPFGMRRTSFTWQQAFEKDYARGHNVNEDSLSLLKRTEAHAAGSMQTTIADYTRFIAAAMQGRRLSEKSKQLLLSAQVPIKYNHWILPPVEKDSVGEYQKIQLSYGLGWGLFTTAFGKAYFKEGHLEGWQHYFICFPGKKLAYIVMTNSSNGESIFQELIEKLTGVTIPWKWEGYTPYRPVAKLSAAQLKKFTGEYEGRLKAIITLEDGRLKVESATVGLPKTNIYPANDHHLFLKIMDAEFEFAEGTDGNFNKIIANDEGEHYELTRVKK